MENTLENKSKFFAQYFGQEIQWDITLPIQGRNQFDYVDVEVRKDDILVLSPLHLISDEDAIVIAVICGDFGSVDNGKQFICGVLGTNEFNYPKSFVPPSPYIHKVIDYLRSKGYSVPFNGLSVEEQVEHGWVKLKTEI